MNLHTIQPTGSDLLFAFLIYQYPHYQFRHTQLNAATGFDYRGVDLDDWVALPTGNWAGRARAWQHEQQATR